MEKKMICKCEEEETDIKKCTLYGHKPGCKGYYDEECDIYNIQKEKSLSGNHPSVMDFWESLNLGQRIDILKNDFDEVEAFKSAKLHFYELPNKITNYLFKKSSKELSGRLVNEELAKTSACNKVESVRYFKKGIAGSLNRKQVEDYCSKGE